MWDFPKRKEWVMTIAREELLWLYCTDEIPLREKLDRRQSVSNKDVGWKWIKRFIDVSFTNYEKQSESIIHQNFERMTVRKKI